METPDKIKYGALAFAGLKFVQGVSRDLAEFFTIGSYPSILSFGVGQSARIGSSLGAAYALENSINSVERLIMPKSTQGALTAILSTFGVGAMINYLGNYFGCPISENLGSVGNEMAEIPETLSQGAGVLENTKILVNGYASSLEKLVTFDSEVNGGYLTGGLATLKSLVRLTCNLMKGVAEQSSDKIKKNRKI